MEKERKKKMKMGWLKDAVIGERAPPSPLDCGQRRWPHIGIPRWCLPPLGDRILGIGGVPRSTRTFEMSPTKIVSCPASVMCATTASSRRLQSSTCSISSSQLSRGMRPQACASISATSRRSRSHSFLSTKTFFSPSILSRTRVCLAWAMCAHILSRYF
jgi:hypothetical protein